MPGLQVARIDARGWAVSARGFNDRFANKLQVLVDGHSIYSNVISSVVWEEQYVPVDEIECIEVIRGPGGSLWGANSVNGVINIITREAAAADGTPDQAAGLPPAHGSRRSDQLGRRPLRTGSTADDRPPRAAHCDRRRRAHLLGQRLASGQNAEPVEMHALFMRPSEGDVPVTVVVHGNGRLRPEELHAYELGWRFRPDARFAFDAALFSHEYRQLMVAALTVDASAGPSPDASVNFQFENALQAQARGAELSAEWALAPWLRLHAGGQVLDVDIPGPAAVTARLNVSYEHAWSLAARLDLPHRIDLDLGLRAVGKTTGLPMAVPGYESLDPHVGWQPTESLRLSLDVENLLDDEHIEYFDELALMPGTTFGRSTFARFSWRGWQKAP